ncbi:MAG: hypothetical protein IIZ39_03565 [Blautia sp.]|nr:hypothetical protein [Blautia sp.]
MIKYFGLNLESEDQRLPASGYMKHFNGFNGKSFIQFDQFIRFILGKEDDYVAYPRLRSNTFVTLLLRDGRPELGSRREWGTSTDGITHSGLLAELIRLSMPSYQPKRPETLTQYFSRYIQGAPPKSQQYLPFESAECRRGLAERLQKESGEVLREMDHICHAFLDLADFKVRLLAGGLVEIILKDESFQGKIDTGYEWVDKDALERVDRFILQPFLTSVWSIILSDYPDTTEGAETYLKWTEEAGFKAPRTITTTWGEDRAQRIAVSTTLPDASQASASVPPEAQTCMIPGDDIIQDNPGDGKEKERQQQTLISHNGRIYNQNAEKITNIEHVDVLYI